MGDDYHKFREQQWENILKRIPKDVPEAEITKHKEAFDAQTKTMEPQIEKFVKALDANNDGCLNSEEWEKHFMAMAAPHIEEAKAKMAGLLKEIDDAIAEI